MSAGLATVGQHPCCIPCLLCVPVLRHPGVLFVPLCAGQSFRCICHISYISDICHASHCVRLRLATSSYCFSCNMFGPRHCVCARPVGLQRSLWRRTIDPAMWHCPCSSYPHSRCSQPAAAPAAQTTTVPATATVTDPASQPDTCWHHAQHLHTSCLIRRPLACASERARHISGYNRYVTQQNQENLTQPCTPHPHTQASWYSTHNNKYIFNLETCTTPNSPVRLPAPCMPAAAAATTKPAGTTQTHSARPSSSSDCCCCCRCRRCKQTAYACTCCLPCCAARVGALMAEMPVAPRPATNTLTS